MVQVQIVTAKLCALSWCLWTLIVGEVSFYHETSKRIISSPLRNHSQFGFSLAYQPGMTARLVIGAPRADLDGHVYSCGMDEILLDKINCTKLEIDLNKIAKGDRMMSENQEFWLGASVATTSDTILTCAPLWSKSYTEASVGKGRTTHYGTFGHCFTYGEGGARSVNGLFDEVLKSPRSSMREIMSGFGWAAIADEEANCFVIGKPAGDYGYMSYMDISSQSIRHSNKKIFSKYRHVGNAMVAGNFFSDVNGTVVAFSLSRKMKGMILFMKFKNGVYELVTEENGGNIAIIDGAVGAMFGEALCAADLNVDSRAELIVGSPTHAKDARRYDVGAVHIYLSGPSISVDDSERKFTILGNQDGGRFGSAIVNAGDIDSDGFPEICVSAPFEDGGTGAVYILPGIELKEFLEEESKTINLNQLKSVQRLQSSSATTFGYSLLVVKDVDDNGCNELVVGAPGMDSVIFYRCMPNIQLTISAVLQDYVIVPENVTSFYILVCLNITYPAKPDNISSTLIVNNTIVGNGVTVKNKARYSIDLSSKKEIHCENVTIFASNNDPGHYELVTVVHLENNSLHVTDFDEGWVALHQRTMNLNRLDVARGCNTVACTPRLTVSLKSTIGNNKESYKLGSSRLEEATLTIRNEGDSAYRACVHIALQGPSAARVNCAGLTCHLPKPFVRGATFPVKIQLNMTALTNLDSEINIRATADKNCDNLNVTHEVLTYNVEPNIANIKIEGDDKEWILAVNENKGIAFEQTYSIFNEDIVVWRDLIAHIKIERKSYFHFLSVKVAKTELLHADDTKQFVEFLPMVQLAPKSVTAVTLSMLLMTNITKDYFENGVLSVNSSISLELVPTAYKLQKSISHSFKLQELRIDQNKNLMMLIFIFLGLLLLIILAVVLYKCGFFTRKEKIKLEALKQEIRRQSVKRYNPDTGEEDADENLPAEDPTIMEVVDDRDGLIEREKREDRTTQL